MKMLKIQQEKSILNSKTSKREAFTSDWEMPFEPPQQTLCQGTKPGRHTDVRFPVQNCWACKTVQPLAETIRQFL